MAEEIKQAERISRKKKKGTSSPLREVWYQTSDGADVLVLKFPMLEQLGFLEHCFSTRIGGVSKNEFASMNLSFSRGDNAAAVRTNYERLAEVLGVTCEQFVFTDQTHTANVRKVTAADAGKGIVRERDYTDIDGLITNETGVVLSAFYADCVPLYFADPVHRAIGLSHSGWRGTALRMGRATIEAMRREYGTSPKELFCAIAPSICQACYEVSADVAAVFAQEFAGHETEILRESSKNRGKYQLDLWRANELVLLEAGVPKEHIAVTDICTCCNSELLYSHRASGGRRGNLGAYMYLKNSEE